MGKPRMIILVRHGQSEGNKNREVHQIIPDHRVKLTPDGRQQAEEAGRRLRSMLRPDDTVRFFTSPYRRTRETTEGILRTLTGDDLTPSPFPRHTIKVYEEPRLREQDFGNFQPCSAEMERMWQERADYGHFFYRIPNGESAADAYDRVSGFNESLWRSFGEQDFPSVCVLVTHGLMTRVFLMKWYHWSVEYFEDLRNINHCEFIVMKQNEENAKYVLQNQLRTWSDLKKRAAVAENKEAKPSSSTTTTSKTPTSTAQSPVATRKWGGCAQGCNHQHMNFPRRTRRQNTSDFLQPASGSLPASNEKSDHPIAPKAGEGDAPPQILASTPETTEPKPNEDSNDDSRREKSDQDNESGIASGETSPLVSPANPPTYLALPHRHRPSILRLGRDGGGSRSGTTTPAELLSDDSDYFSSEATGPGAGMRGFKRLRALGASRRSGKTTLAMEQGWIEQSGMGTGARADALGDQSTEEEDGDGEDSEEEVGQETPGTGRSAVSEVEVAEKLDKSVRGSVY
ncbi:MAG: hypothetical protein M1820_005987 [Bogoriella megaspora]|nr:MAG: hypothetical protein M1820_005987 [Bogoriella megaspora]